MKRQKGFTLVELLVVIAIIAVLAGAVLLAINPTSLIQKSRDSKRLSDMDTIVKAVTLAITEGEITMAAAGPFDSTTGQQLDGSGWVALAPATDRTGLSKYIPALPIDPINDPATGFVYTFQSTATDFEINAVFEHVDNLTKMSLDGGNNDGAYEAGTSLTIIGGAIPSGS